MKESVHLLGKSGGPLGVLTRSADADSERKTGVVFLNSGLLHRVGPFCLYVTLARRLATHGYPSIRIDQSGKGDSERRTNINFDESMRQDCVDAIDFMKSCTSANRFVVIGLCSGADDSLFVANNVEAVCGAALLEAFAFRTLKYYRRHYLPRLLRPKLYWIALRRAARAVASRLLMPSTNHGQSGDDFGVVREFSGDGAIRERYRRVIDHGTKLLCVFTDGSRSYYNYVGQLNESLGIPGSERFIQEHYLPGAKHTYPIVGDRVSVIEIVVNWLLSEFSE